MLLQREIVKFSHPDPFSQFCSTVADSFCPYLRPAEERNCLYLSTYVVQADNQAKAQEEMFYISIAHTEMLRKQRRFETRPGTALLICDNLSFIIEGHAAFRDMEKLISWPHWMLKNLYLDVGFMFGKFAVGQQRISRSGEDLPEPPIHFMSIRSLVKERDPYFFTKTPELLANAINAIDDGRNVHAPFLEESILENVEEMRKHSYFSNVLERLSIQLPEPQRKGADYLLSLLSV